MTPNTGSGSDLLWLLPPESGGREDPLAFAQKWFLESAERNRLLATKEKAIEEKRLKGETNTQDNAEETGDSPAYHRTTAPGDAQAIAGVYPTPPDGVNLRGPASVEASNSTPGAAANASISMSQGDQAEEKHGEDYDMDGNGDVFGSATDGMLFDEHDITEADFSFFDEPDLEGGDDLMEGVDSTDFARQGQEDQLMEEVDDTKDDTTGLNAPVEDPSAEKEGTPVVDVIKQEESKEDMPLDDAVVSQVVLSNVSSPAFTPSQVLNRLLPGLDAKSVVQSGGELIVEPEGDYRFKPIELNDNLRKFDEKYSSSGRFAMPEIAVMKPRSTDPLRSSGSAIPVLKIHRSDHDAKSTQKLGEKMMDISGSSSSGSDSSSVTEDESDDDDDDDDGNKTSFSANEELPFNDDRDLEVPTAVSHIADGDVSATSRGDSMALDTKVFGTSGKSSPTKTISPTHNIDSSNSSGDFIKIAQLTADQLITALDRTQDSEISEDKDEEDAESSIQLSFETQLETAEVNRLDPSHIRVRRAEGIMELLPPALTFWETFGLSPLSGSKNVASLCLIPPGDGLGRCTKMFLAKLGGTYSNCRLGLHVASTVTGSENGIITIQLPESSLSRHGYMQELMRSCTQLGTSLVNRPKPHSNIVVYIANPFGDDQGTQGICSAFYSLLQAYNRSRPTEKTKSLSDVVLQVLPMAFITSPDGLNTLSQPFFTRLAFTVYERCTVVQQDSSDRNAPLYSAPRFTISQPPPKSVDFRLSAAPLAFSMMNDDSYIHVAYSRSTDGRWISAAWTDTWGRFQHAASYYCGGLRGPSAAKNRQTMGLGFRPQAEIFREIWDTTAEIVRSKAAAKWRSVVIKTGSPSSSSSSSSSPLSSEGMSDDERREWTQLLAAARPGSGSASTSTTTATVTAASSCSTSPSGVPSCPSPSPIVGLRLLSAVGPERHVPSKHALGRLQQLSSGSGTMSVGGLAAGSTPLTNTQSPESSTLTTPAAATNAGTPTDTPLEHDPEASLVDVGDETWSVVLVGKGEKKEEDEEDPNDVDGVAEDEQGSRPARGWLVKRGGPREGDGLVAWGVRAEDHDSSGSNGGSRGGGGRRGAAEEEEEMGEILGMYRRLATVGRQRGVIEGTSTLPWHVVAAGRAAAGLEGTM